VFYRLFPLRYFQFRFYWLSKPVSKVVFSMGFPKSRDRDKGYVSREIQGPTRCFSYPQHQLVQSHKSFLWKHIIRVSNWLVKYKYRHKQRLFKRINNRLSRWDRRGGFPAQEGTKKCSRRTAEVPKNYPKSNIYFLKRIFWIFVCKESRIDNCWWALFGGVLRKQLRYCILQGKSAKSAR